MIHLALTIASTIFVIVFFVTITETVLAALADFWAVLTAPTGGAKRARAQRIEPTIDL